MSTNALARQRRSFISNGVATLILSDGTHITVEALLQAIPAKRVGVDSGRGRLIGPGPTHQYPAAGEAAHITLHTIPIVCSTPVRYRPPGINTKPTGEAEVCFAFDMADLP